MSQKRTIELTCPMCGKPAPFTLWDSVNNVLNPELEEQLLKNTFALFSCPHCGGQNYVAYDFLYHDMQKGRMIYLLHSREEKDREKMNASLGQMCRLLGGKIGHTMHPYSFRLVHTLDEMREKIIILHDDLDDRIVEISKLFIRERLKNDHVEALALRYGWGAVDGKQQPVMYVFEPGGKMGMVPYTRQLYDVLESFFELGQDADGTVYEEIDEAWAADMIRKYGGGLSGNSSPHIH